MKARKAKMLETEIKRLNANIEHLNKLLEAMADTAKQGAAPAVEKKHPEPTPEVEKEVAQPPEENEQGSGYTTDDIKSMALAISRKDRSKQKDIKAKLAEHDAKIATDLSGDALQAVGDYLKGLKEELGG